MSTTNCPTCKMFVSPKTDGTCPNCQTMLIPQEGNIDLGEKTKNIRNMTECPNCGGSISSGAAICAYCGTNINHPIRETSVANVTGFADQSQNGLPEMVAEPLLDTFNVAEIKGFKKQPTWTVSLFSTQAEFSCPETGARILIPRTDANTLIFFPQGGLFAEGTSAVISGVSFEFGNNKSRLLNWLPLKNSEVLIKDLKGWGISLLAIGVLSIIFSKMLDPIWGGVLIVLGIVNLLVKNRVMFIVNGLALIFIGVLNALSVIMASSGFNLWLGFGVFQVIWGIQEIKKYKRYAPKNASEPAIGIEKGVEQDHTNPPKEISSFASQQINPIQAERGNVLPALELVTNQLMHEGALYWGEFDGRYFYTNQVFLAVADTLPEEIAQIIQIRKSEKLPGTRLEALIPNDLFNMVKSVVSISEFINARNSEYLRLSAGDINVFVDPLLFNYMKAQYPSASVGLISESKPVFFMQDEKLVGLLMIKHKVN